MIAIRINDALAQLQTVSEVAIRDAGPSTADRRSYDFRDPWLFERCGLPAELT
jgi:hypothetical protein